MAERCPALLDQAATALQGKDWLYFCCTGQRATDPASAASAFGDCRTGAYDLRTLELMGLPEVARLLPEALDGTRAPGELTGAAAAATGLLPGTPVVLGPVDLIAAALVAGLAQPELRLGCSVLDPEGGGCHIRAEHAPPKIPGTASEIAAVLPFAGLWFKLARGPVPVGRAWLIGLAAQLLADAGLIGIGRGELVGILEHKATAARPVALRLHPGAGAADQAGFLGISGATTIYDLLRAICEADGLAARTGYEALGGRPEEIRIVGDGAQSPLARRILAACIDAPVRRLCRETPAAAGAALIAARALGHDLAGDWAGPHLADVEPVDRDLRAIYAKLPGRAPAARDLPAVDA
jgi:erythritol kinase